MSKKPSKDLTIRSSTAEFLIFTNQAGEDSIEVRYQDDTIWLTQKLMAELFEITKHLQNIFNDNELGQDSVCAKTYAADGKKQSVLQSGRHHLGRLSGKLQARHAIPPMGNPGFAEFAIKGYVLDKHGWRMARFSARTILSGCWRKSARFV